MAFKYLKNISGSDITISTETFTNGVLTDITGDMYYLCESIYQIVTDIDSGDFEGYDADGTTLMSTTDTKAAINLLVNQAEGRNTYGQ